MNERLKKIKNHPDKDEIIERFSRGESIREVQKWLNCKYRVWSKHNKISAPTLQLFRKEVMKLDGKVLEDLKKIKKEKDKELEKEYIEQQVISTNAYKEKLNQVANTHLDVAGKILQMDAIIGDRLEYWFNLLKSGDQLPPKADNELRKYIDQQMIILQQYKKLVEGMADKKIDYNVNITVMNEQISTIQSTIRELITEELEPEKAIIFLDKLTDRLNNAQLPKELPAKVTTVEFDKLE